MSRSKKGSDVRAAADNGPRRHTSPRTPTPRQTSTDRPEPPTSHGESHLRRNRGRPRDPRLDGLILDAASQVYSSEGWAGFNFDAIAKKAGVGKAAIYLRWAGREDLVIDAIRSVTVTQQISESRNLHDACMATCIDMANWWVDGRGAAYLRLQIDQFSFPFLRALYQARVVTPLIESFRGGVHDAIRNEEMPTGTSPTLLVETLCGTLLMHMAAVPERERRQLLDKPYGYFERLTTMTLAGVAAAAKR